MSRYFIELAYKGTPYCGWQYQPNGKSVQEELERAFGILLREDVRITGAGRTDAGVHALYYVAHFEASRDDLQNDISLIYKLNGILPREIAIYGIYSVPPHTNARFNAISRTYNYKIATRKNPFTIDYAYHFYRPLEVSKMNESAAILLEYNDFASFQKLPSDAKTTLCHVQNAQWIDDHNGELLFVITADRFLRNMVRAIVGTMIDIGVGKYLPEDMHRIILEKDRGMAGASAPPQGLYLANIEYPEIPGFHSAAGKPIIKVVPSP